MIDELDKQAIINRVRSFYKRVNEASGGIVSIVFDAVRRFGEVRATQSAAAITYYTLFSVFPLLLFVVAIGSVVLQSAEIQQQLFTTLEETLPPAAVNLIEGNIQQVLRLRGPVTVLGSIGLLWSATAVFTVLTEHINRAWHKGEKRSFVRRRLMAVLIVAGLIGLLVASLVFDTVLNLLSRFEVPLWGGLAVYETMAWQLFSALIPLLFVFATFLLLYRWVPNTRVNWSEAAWGALVAVAGLSLVQRGFDWYLSSGLAKYQLVYGSLGAVVASMLWVYLSSIIIIFGAHLSAAIGYRHRPEQEEVDRTTNGEEE